MPHPRQDLLEDEWLIVRHSGEIPEIALHSALYFLTEDPQGPRLQLGVEEIQHLREAAASRYEEIILRDLCYENRELTIYRGIRRAIFNWHRFVAFCDRQKIPCHRLHAATAESFLLLLNKVSVATDKATPDSIFNCTFHDLVLFARELGIPEQQLPANIRQLCQE